VKVAGELSRTFKHFRFKVKGQFKAGDRRSQSCASDMRRNYLAFARLKFP